MAHSTLRRRAHQIETLRTQFGQADGLAFAEVLPAERVERALSPFTGLPVTEREEGATWVLDNKERIIEFVHPGCRVHEE